MKIATLIVDFFGVSLSLSQTDMKEPIASLNLPTIPSKQYFAIGEVSKLCDVKPHVLRYWEQEFSEIKPVKRRGNRRYYQREDILIIRRIRALLYEQGYTIAGARSSLTGEEARDDASISNMLVKQTVEELEEVLRILKS